MTKARVLTYYFQKLVNKKVAETLEQRFKAPLHLASIPG